MKDEGRTSAYSLDEEEFVDFNPLEDFEFESEPDEDGLLPGVLDEGPYSMPAPENAQKFKLVAFDNADTARERIDTLFDQMPTLQRMLIDILGMCREPIAAEELEERVAKLQEHHHSIYSPATFCSLLERAGALIQCDEDGNPLSEFEQEPLRVTIDGAEYWRVAPAPKVHWVVTEEGLERYRSYEPVKLTRALFEAEPHYARIFQTVLELCAQEGGSPIKDLDAHVEDEPEVQQPRRYAMYFVDKLEHTGGIEWQGSWVATEAGLQVLAERRGDSQEQAED